MSVSSIPVKYLPFQLLLILSVDRYWGKSSPFANLTAETLQYLNLEQNIADLVYFAKTVKLPFDTNGSSNADKAVSFLPSLASTKADLSYKIALGPYRRII